MMPDSQGREKPEIKLRFEIEAWNQGKRRVAGVDEVGRGPLAGPVVAACVVFSERLLRDQVPNYLYEVDDSKKLTPGKRETLAAFLHKQEGLEVGIGVVDQAVIDRINILEATRLAMCQAIQQIAIAPEHLLVDGIKLPGVSISQTAIIKGDGLSVSIGAASIIAKVHRDRMMQSYDAQYPGYGFAQHKGYGTAEHLEKLRQLGPCLLHRRSFAPVGALE